jgi:hypothetical protein
MISDLSVPIYQEEYDFEAFENAYNQTETIVEAQSDPNGVVEIIDQERTTELGTNGALNGVHPEQPQQQQQQQQMLVESQQPTLFDMDLERMHIDFYKGRYLTPQDFLDDVSKIVHNAGIRMGEDPLALLEADIVDTIYQILTGVLPSTSEDGEEQGDTSGSQGLGSGLADMIVMENLAHRSKDQVEEALSLISELMPPLPKGMPDIQMCFVSFTYLDSLQMVPLITKVIQRNHW